MSKSIAPLMYVNPEIVQKRLQFLKPIGIKLRGLYPGLEYDLRNAGVIGVTTDIYTLSALLSSFLWAFVFGFILSVLVQFAKITKMQATMAPFVGFFMILLLLFILYLFYPKIAAKNVAYQTDRDLVYAARDMLVQVKSGIPLDIAMRNVASSSYGYLSAEFGRVVRDMAVGKSTVNALEDMALHTQSEYLKKMTWQLVTTIRAGANVTAALKSVVGMLVNYQFSLIKKYNAELNFLVLIYLMSAAVLPTVGVTVLVIFSVFGILGITPEVFTAIVLFSFLIQLMLALFIYYQRPNIY